MLSAKQKTNIYLAKGALRMSLRVRKCFPVGALLATAMVVPTSLADGQLSQLRSVFVEADSVESNQRSGRIPDRVSNRVLVRADRPLIEIDPEIQVPPEDITQRTFSLDALGTMDDIDVDLDELYQVMQPWLSRSLTFVEFQLAGMALLQHLNEHGHPNATLRFSQMQFLENQQVAVAIDGLSPLVPYQDATPRIQVAGFDVRGLTLLDEAELQAMLSEAINSDLTLEELMAITDQITAALRDKGYGLAQAWLPPQEIEDGIVSIQVVEGIVDATAGLDGITVVTADESRIKDHRIHGALARVVGPDDPLNVDQMERALRILNEAPGIASVTTELKPGNEPGTTQVIANVEETNIPQVITSIDNYGSVFSGEERATINLNLNSPFGYTEQLFASVTNSESATSYKLGFHAPVGYSGFRMGASYSDFRIKISEIPAQRPDLSQNSSAFSVFANYPLVRTISASTDLFASADFKEYNSDYYTGSLLYTDKVNSVTLGASGYWLDGYQGRNNWSGALTTGSHSGNFAFGDGSGGSQSSVVDSSFAKLNVSGSRLQQLHQSGWFAYAGLTGQWSSNSLYGAEKFQLGGPSGVRGWPIGEGLGDSGWLLNVELRKQFAEFGPASVEAVGFYDIGGVNNDSKASAYVNERLAGYGVGLSMSYGQNGNIKLVYAEKDRGSSSRDPNQADSGGHNDKGRLWLIGTLVF